MRPRLMLLSAALIPALFLLACQHDHPRNIPVVDHGSEEKGIVNYGNGVYYFPRTIEDQTTDFPLVLAHFKGDHPDLEVVAMTGQGIGGMGTDIGYVVVFRERQPPTAPVATPAPAAPAGGP